MNLKRIIPALCLLLYTQGCMSSADISYLPPSNKYVDFNIEGKSGDNHFVYLLTIEDYILEDVYDSIQTSLQFLGYKIISKDFLSGKVAAKRGWNKYEWGAGAAVYFKHFEDVVKVKIICMVSRDAEGGWKKDYAVNIAYQLQKHLEQYHEKSTGSMQ